MADPFTTTIQNLKGKGFFEFMLPFMLTAAIFYGLLRKSQIFGPAETNIAINAVVSLTAALMVWSYPVLAGVDLTTQFPTFFVQASVAMLVITISLLMVSMFVPPNLPGQISEKLGGRLWVILVVALLIGGGILISSGMIIVFFPSGVGSVTGGIDQDTILTLGVLGLFFGTILVMVWGGGKGK